MLFRNTLAQSSTTVSSMVLSVVLAPILIGQLGLAAFGVWAVTGAFASYAALFDLGITRAIGRYVAEYDAKGEKHLIGQVVGLGLLAATFVGICTFAVAWLLAPVFSRSLGQLNVDDMRIVLLSSAAIIVLQIYKKVLNAVPFGLRRMVPPNVMNVIGNFTNFGLSVAVLLVSPNLVDYALVNAFATFLALLGALGSTLYVIRPLPVAFPTRQVASDAFSYGWRVQVPWIADMVNMQTDKIILAFLIDVRVAAAYEIAARVANATKAVGVMTTSAMMPTAVKEIVDHGRRAVPRFHLRYSRLSVGLAFPLFVVACVAAPVLLFAWLGQVPDQTAIILVGLSLANFSGMAAGVGGAVAHAAGEAGKLASTATVSATVNVALKLVLTPWLGLAGVLLSTFVAIFVGAFLFLRSFHREFGIRNHDFFRAIGPPLGLSLAVGGPLSLISFLVETPSSRLAAVAVLGAIVTVYALVYWVLASRFGFLPAKLTLPAGRRRRARPIAAS